MSSVQPYDPWNAFRNPFVPPSIKETVVKKIESRQFVDFIDLLPENQVTSIDSQKNYLRDRYYNFKMIFEN